jgi:hypothetical protein
MQMLRCSRTLETVPASPMTTFAPGPASHRSRGPAFRLSHHPRSLTKVRPAARVAARLLLLRPRSADLDQLCPVTGASGLEMLTVSLSHVDPIQTSAVPLPAIAPIPKLRALPPLHQPEMTEVALKMFFERSIGRCQLHPHARPGDASHRLYPESRQIGVYISRSSKFRLRVDPHQGVVPILRHSFRNIIFRGRL